MSNKTYRNKSQFWRIMQLLGSSWPLETSLVIYTNFTRSFKTASRNTPEIHGVFWVSLVHTRHTPYIPKYTCNSRVCVGRVNGGLSIDSFMYDTNSVMIRNNIHGWMLSKIGWCHFGFVDLISFWGAKFTSSWLSLFWARKIIARKCHWGVLVNGKSFCLYRSMVFACSPIVLCLDSFSINYM